MKVNGVDPLLEELFLDQGLKESRHRLVRSWRQAGFHRQETLAHAARQAAIEQSDIRLIVTSRPVTHELTLSTLWERAQVVAAGLRKLGVRPGDTVAVQLPNSPEAFCTYLAVNILGAVLTPIPQIYGPAETKKIIEMSHATAFAVAKRAERDDSLDWLGEAREMTRVVVVGDGPSWAIPWAALEEYGSAVDEPVGNGDSPAALLYTSGTTGVPKGVLHTNNSILAYLDIVPCPSFEFEGVFLWSWPSGHIGAILAAISPIVRRIDTVLFGEVWDTEFLIETILKYGIAGMSGVTTIGLRLLDSVETRKLVLPLKEFFTGGASIPTVLVERAEAQNWHLTRSYGSTENPVATATRPSDPNEARINSEGRAVRGARVRIVREDGTDCLPTEDGEVLLVSPQQMIGYNDPVLNAESFTADGWLRTGDIGRLDVDGFLTITDRKKDIVIRGGENISSQEVERALMRIAGVREAAVVAMPDPELGERACAYLIVDPKTHVDLNVIRSHFEAMGLARQKCPERIEIVEDFPRTPSGKVVKKSLRDQLRGIGGNRDTS
jgi:acyl-CoA synthetase (AMP-forming)/AMP-acid ligase II